MAHWIFAESTVIVVVTTNPHELFSKQTVSVVSLAKRL